MKLFLTSRKRGEIEKRPSLANQTCRSPSVHTKPEVQGKDNNCIAMEINFHSLEKKQIHIFLGVIHAILHVASPHFPHFQKSLKHPPGTQCGLIS